MKVFIYDNKEKDFGGQYLLEIKEMFKSRGVECVQLFDEELNNEEKADAIFTLGGDGTILWVVEFANKNSIPIIGINIGKIGFLTEFERLEMQNAVDLFINGKLIKEERLTLKVCAKGKTSFALNDAYVQREYSEKIGCVTADFSVKIDDKQAEVFKGDGVIVSSPTGSTAYSLAVGGAILAPDVDALCVTPIAAHALGLRSIVFSANSVCKLELTGKAGGFLFVDGRIMCAVEKGDVVSVEKSNVPTVFLRRVDSNFYNKLSVKLKDGFRG